MEKMEECHHHLVGRKKRLAVPGRIFNNELWISLLWNFKMRHSQANQF